MLNFFRQPYRETGTAKSRIYMIAGFGLFIFLFLFIFKPFGLIGLKPLQQLFMTLGFGAVTTVMLIVFKFLLEPFFVNKKWTLGNHIVWDLIIASSIGVANYFYIFLIFGGPFSIKYLFTSMWIAILVGVIPVTISYIINYNVQYRNALKEADIPEEKIFWDEEVILTAGNEKNEVKVNPREILYICSNDNYVTIVTIKEGSPVKTTIRGTLLSAEEELSRNTRFLRCHKCYIINLDYVEKITGNSQNMKVRLKHTDDIIPVSRAKAGLLT
ncbi:MAG TPA: LytTR family DNA-binding domain-containing protein [Bacteroidales bacterium]|nr:LytTR family DNA-binding domain-containing protein [Bacteroidales bacterium]